MRRYGTYSYPSVSLEGPIKPLKSLNRRSKKFVFRTPGLPIASHERWPLHCEYRLTVRCDSCTFAILCCNIYYYYYYYYYYYLLRLGFRSVAVSLTLVQTKQIIYINETIQKHSTNNTKTQYKQYKNTVNASTHITKTPKHPHITEPKHTIQGFIFLRGGTPRVIHLSVCLFRGKKGVFKNVMWYKCSSDALYVFIRSPCFTPFWL